MNLALKYRPRTFDEVVGQKVNSVILKAMVAKNSLPQVLLFTGPSGVGKTSMARIVAAELNPDAKEDVHNGTHPAVLEIDAASNGSVDRIRQLKKDVLHVIPGHRVVIIDEAHAISDEGKSALLNMLEFMVPNVTFILVTTEIHKIPETIRHRCEHYRFKIANVEDLVARLQVIVQAEGIEMEDDLLSLIANNSEGSFRESCMILRQISVAGIKTVEQYKNLFHEVDFGPILIKSALSGPSSALKELEYLLTYTPAEDILNTTVETLKDIMLLKGGISLTYSGKALENRLELASELTTEQILKAMRFIWDAQTKLTGLDTIRSLQLVFSLSGEVLQVVKAVPKNNTTLSFEQMKKYNS